MSTKKWTLLVGIIPTIATGILMYIIKGILIGLLSALAMWLYVMWVAKIHKKSAQ